jgi:DNA-binding response OmpR family regulator
MALDARVLIIEDEAGIRLTLGDRLAAEGCSVDFREDGPSGEDAALAGGYDIVLLDLMLPGRDGLDVCARLREAGVETPILMLTARGASPDIVAGLGRGADDYLAKPFDMGVLIARMEALLRRVPPDERGVRGGCIRFGEFVLNRDKGGLSRAGVTVPLNAQEYRLLDYLAQRPGRVIGRDDILDDVWGYDPDTSTRTVDVHVARLRARLTESALPRHILTVRGRGYKFTP